jgi:hypothetical protein
MNPPLLRALDIEAHALSTLTAASDARVIARGRTASSVPLARTLARTSRVLLLGAILAIAACAIAFGFLSARVRAPAVGQAHQSPKVTAAMKKIAPADPLDRGSPVFIGTGDGSNGSWTKP